MPSSRARSGRLALILVLIVGSATIVGGGGVLDAIDEAEAGPFPDVPAGSWYAPAASWAADHGIMSGYRDGSFGGDRTAPRSQVVMWLWRQAGSPTPTGPGPYRDVADAA